MSEISEINELDFTLELSSEHLSDEEEDELYAIAEERLRRLAAGHTDMIGAAINISRPASGETAYLHEATVVVYGRPENVAASEKESNAPLALKGALDAAERQIRKHREKRKRPW
jgi:ribosome-associated translation inhibitor RaiA